MIFSIHNIVCTTAGSPPLLLALNPRSFPHSEGSHFGKVYKSLQRIPVTLLRLDAFVL